MIAASVIICTHNPRPDYLRRVLDALRAQTLPVHEWELLVVDNASQPPLAPDWDLSWHPQARHVREGELGLAHARQRGMREAAAELLVFVDDDNVLAGDYLAEAVRIGRQWPQLGVWGSGSISPEFEVQPPAHLKELLWCLCLRAHRAPAWGNIATCAEAVPHGAGMCVRAQVAAAYCDHYRRSAIRLTDRIGKDLVSHGDHEISYVACAQGLGAGVFPELCITHLIPKERLTEDYLLRLIKGIRTSGDLLGYKWLDTMPRWPFSGGNFLRIIKNITLGGRVKRRAHLASVRGTFRARSIIAAALRHDSAHEGNGG